jgi:hypothetical protein
MVSRYALNEKPLLDQIEACGVTPSDGTWLAGGALRRTILGMPMDSDLDFFFSNESALKTASETLKSKGFEKRRESEFNETWIGKCADKPLSVQLIKVMFYDSPEAVIDSFDFTICQLIYDGSTLYCGSYTLFDLARKRITVHRVTYGASTVRRLIKYTKQGFTACQGTFVSILEKIVEDPSRIRGEVEYVD